jgi:hypothetical protein
MYSHALFGLVSYQSCCQTTYNTSFRSAVWHHLSCTSGLAGGIWRRLTLSPSLQFYISSYIFQGTLPLQNAQILIFLPVVRALLIGTHIARPHIYCIGQLPFLIHENRTVSSLPLIIKYVSALKSTTRSDQSETNSHSDTTREAGKPESVAWTAHVELNLGDLVVSTLSRRPRIIYSINVK